MGGDPNTVYFTAGIDNEMHGLFGSLVPVAQDTSGGLGTPGGLADAQAMGAALDVVQLDLGTRISDTNSEASPSTTAQDTQTLKTDFGALVLAEQPFAQDSRHDPQMTASPASGGLQSAATQDIDQLFAAGLGFDR
jgi:hypothetical protein